MREVFKFSLQFVIPNGCNVPYEKIKDCVIFYKENLESPNDDLVKAQWDLWKLKWHHRTGRPKTAIDGLVSFSQSQFPNIYILLQILVILPRVFCFSRKKLFNIKTSENLLEKYYWR